MGWGRDGHYIFKDDENTIPDASTSITLVDNPFPVDYDTIQYHNNYYKLYGENDDDDWQFTEVKAFTDAETLAFKINQYGEYIGELNGTRYYKYNNKNYKLIDNEAIDATQAEIEELIAEREKVTITYGSGNNKKTIEFNISEGETWYQWATDKNDTTDGLDLSGIESGLTLKDIIVQIYNDSNNTGKKITYTIDLGSTRKVYCLVDTMEPGPYGDGSDDLSLEDWSMLAPNINGQITKGATYVFRLEYMGH